jgi:transaldolase/glucose-6-phosphate isomerase
MTSITKLHLNGQSIWYDNIRRKLIEDGTLAGMIGRREIFGVTSNPSIFQKAIANSQDYDDDLQTMSLAGMESEEIFYRLAIQDIQEVADLFRPLYDSSGGKDGFVSLEVNPNLARQTEATIEEARWLWEVVDRPNLMIKIPATKEGLPAITEAIASGINVNVTLIFSRKRYLEVMDSYLKGLEKRVGAGEDISGIASVASFFVSRLETKVDDRLEAILQEGGERADIAKQIKGQLAVDNTRLAYREYEDFFGQERFEKLAEAGAQRQRPLWASTSTKDPAYSDVKYVEELVAENTVNTVPPRTLEAFLDHGHAAETIYDCLVRAEEDFKLLSDLGISMDQITQELEDEGVQKFADSFEALMETIEKRRNAFIAALGPLAESVKEQFHSMMNAQVFSRIHRIDPTVWTKKPDGAAEVQKRLGWLDLPEDSQYLIPDLQAFAEEGLAEGFEKVLLLGMGGSSLAPETMQLILGDVFSGMELIIVDSTIPEQIRSAESWVDYAKTLFIVASKSGTTSETMSFFYYFWDRAGEILGDDRGSHFIAITDPGSRLTEIGEESGFRAVFTANPNVGGRYSALTFFGLVPAALMGIDLEVLLKKAAGMAHRCSQGTHAMLNPGAVLGTIIGTAARKGRDKLTLLADETLAPLGAWLEQLVAESSGKEGRGIVPIADEPLVPVDSYGSDRLFVYLRMAGDLDGRISALESAGQPVVVLDIPDLIQLAAEFYRWEFAIAVACSVLSVNAFDQPDVQDNKNRTKAKLESYQETGTLEEPDVIWEAEGVQVFGQAFDGLEDSSNLFEVITGFTGQAAEGDYVALNAYLPRNGETTKALQALREKILSDTGRATTLGFGPRFLHSTGQLHKGGPNTGVFLQITRADSSDLDVPGKDYSFGVLARAQAQGDLEALLARDRRAIRIHLPANHDLKF